MNPVIMYHDEAVVKAVENALVAHDNEGKHVFDIVVCGVNSDPCILNATASRKDFMRYVDELIGSNDGGNLSLPSPKTRRKENEVPKGLTSQETKSCLNTVNTITRPFRKGTCQALV